MIGVGGVVCARCGVAVAPSEKCAGVAHERLLCTMYCDALRPIN